VVGANLTASGPTTTLACDDHGNMTRFGFPWPEVFPTALLPILVVVAGLAGLVTVI
jgi:hypothetical protein